MCVLCTVDGFSWAAGDFRTWGMLASLAEQCGKDMTADACLSKAAGGCLVQAFPPVLAGHLESAKMASASTWFHRESFNSSLSLQHMLLFSK